MLGLLVWAIALLPTGLLLIQQPEDVGLQPDGDPPVPADHGASSYNASGDAAVAALPPAAEEPVWTLREAMRTPTLWIVATVAGALFLVQAGVNTHLAAYLRDQGLNAAFAGIGISLNAIFLGLGSIAWGWIVERIPARRVLAAIGVAVAGASALFITAGNAAEAVAYSALFGFGVGGLLSVPPVIYADYYGATVVGRHPRRGRAADQLRAGHRRRAVGRHI